jgi:hypothetical protein
MSLNNTLEKYFMLKLSFCINIVFLVILAPTIPKEDDLPIVPEPHPTPSVPEEPVTSLKPVPTGMMSLLLVQQLFLRRRHSWR